MVPIIVPRVLTTKATRWGRSALLVALIAAMASGGCSGTIEASETAPSIVVSTSIWADVVENLVCDDAADAVTIEVVFDTSADPHTAEVHLSDRASLQDAALIVVNGGGLEATLDDTVSAVAADGVPVLDLSSTLGDLVVDDDPHFWLDPTIVAVAIDPLATKLVDIGLDEATVRSCADRYRTELEALDAEITDRFGALSVDQRRLAVVHGLAYYARRYELDIVATVDPGTSHSSPSPSSLAATIDSMEQQDVTVVATEVNHHSDDVNALKAAIDNLVEVPLYTGGLGTDADADTYVEMMQQNTTRLATALDS